MTDRLLKSPTKFDQYKYYDKYIKPQNTRHSSLTRRQTTANTQQERLPGGFIPLRDLLRKNHADRVQDYLIQLEEEEAQENKKDDEFDTDQKRTNSQIKMNASGAQSFGVKKIATLKSRNNKEMLNTQQVPAITQNLKDSKGVSRNKANVSVNDTNVPKLPRINAKNRSVIQNMSQS